jgi:hypothetical protein
VTDLSGKVVSQIFRIIVIGDFKIHADKKCVKNQQTPQAQVIQQLAARDSDLITILSTDFVGMCISGLLLSRPIALGGWKVLWHHATTFLPIC